MAVTKYDLSHSEDWASNLVYGADLVSTAAIKYWDDSHTEWSVYMYDIIGGIPGSKSTGRYHIQTDVLNNPITYSIHQLTSSGESTVVFISEALSPYTFSDQITGYSAA